MRPRDLGIGRLFERVRDAVIVADAKTRRIVLWNKAATNIFGYSTSEALELRIEALVPEHLKDQYRAGIDRYAGTGHGPYTDSHHRSLELPALKKGGEKIYVELSLSPIGLVGDADGSERYVLVIVRDITERKRAEEEVKRLTVDLENRVEERSGQLEATLTRLKERERELRESEDRYRQFIEQSTEGMWRFELEEPVPMDLTPDEQVERFYRHGYLAECNDAMARMYGYERAEEIVGARLGDLLPSSIPENVEYLKAFINSGYQLTDAESEEVDRHGDTKYFLNNLTGIVENESLLRVWGTQRDISEGKRWEEALQMSEARFRTMIEQSPLSVQILSPEGWTLQVNRAWEELWGVTLNAIAGYNLLEDQQLVAKGIMPYIKRGFAGEPAAIPPIMYDPEETIPGRSSHEEPKRWVGAFIYPIKDEAGNVREVILMHEDITERKRAEEVRARLAAIVESSDDAIIGKTLEGTITDWNRGAQKIYGYSAEEVLGKPINILVPPGRPDEIPKILEKLRHGEAIDHYETVRMTKDGRQLDVSLTISPIKDSSGNIAGASTVARDITERKRAEEVQRLMAEASSVFSSSLDYHETLGTVARLAVPHLADWCVVDILEEEDGSIDRLAVAHQDPERVALAQELEERYPPDPDTPRGVGQVLRTGRPELVPEIPESLIDEAAQDAEHREILKQLGLKSCMIVPLVARGRTLGAISLVSAESGRRYGQGELKLAEELARRAALAVDNARLYRGRGEIVRTLQEGLLPSRLPEMPGIEVGLRYLSAGEIDVGGDFYDIFEVRANGEANPSESSSSWGVAIGDVVGKGAEAATMLSFARYTIRAASMHETRPSAVLTDLNQTMLRQRHERESYKFCTIVYARLDVGDGGAERDATITVTRGGHPAPVLLGADGSISKVAPSGCAIGVFEDANLTEQEVHLAPGAALVLYTDGVIEARAPDGTFFGEERLAALLRSCVGLNASAIAGRLEKAALGFQENNPRDDAAVLVLRVAD